MSYMRPTYGHMYGTNISVAINIVTQDVPVAIPSGLAAENLNNLTFQNAREMVIISAGLYFITWAMAVVKSGVAVEIEGGLMKDGVLQSTTTSHGEIAVSNKPIVLTGSCICLLAAGAVMTLCLANHTNTDDLVLEHLTCSMHRL